MAERQTYSEGFLQVAMPQDTGEARAIQQTFETTAAVLIQSQEKQDQFRISKFSSQADLEMLEATNKYRNANALNPTDKKAFDTLQKEYDKILDKYDGDIGLSAQGLWSDTKSVLRNQYNKSNSGWVQAQNVKNAETNLGLGIEASLDKAYIQGQTADYDTAIETMMLKEDQLRGSVQGLISEAKIQDDMENFRSDYVKSFLEGMIVRDPEQAEQMLQDERIKKTIGSREAENILGDLIKVQKKQISVEQDKKYLANQRTYQDKAIDMTHAERLKYLERGVQKDDFSSTWAKSERNKLLSAKGIDASTQFDKEADFIIEKDAILAAYAEGESTIGGHLKAVEDLSVKINDSIANGEINRTDGERILKSLASKDVDAVREGVADTSFVQNLFTYTSKDAYKMFKNDLSSADAYKATSDYFRNTENESYKNIKKANGENIKTKKEYATYLNEKYRNKTIESKSATVRLKSVETGEIREFPQASYDSLTEEQKKLFEVL